MSSVISVHHNSNRFGSVELILATRADAHVVARLWPLYQYDLSLLGGTPINADGLFEDISMSTHDYRDDLELWWRSRGRLHPFLIRVDGHAAGIVLIGAAPPFTSAGCDFSVIEFFLLRGYREEGIGRSVATEIFRRFAGRWELQVYPKNTVALAFWRRILPDLASHDVIETAAVLDEDGDEMINFHFNNVMPEPAP